MAEAPNYGSPKLQEPPLALDDGQSQESDRAVFGMDGQHSPQQLTSNGPEQHISTPSHASPSHSRSASSTFQFPLLNPDEFFSPDLDGDSNIKPPLQGSLINFYIEVPPVINRHEYEDSPQNHIIQSVLREVWGSGGQILYRVRLASGTKVIIPQAQALVRGNGKEAIDQFYNDNDARQQRHSSEDSMNSFTAKDFTGTAAAFRSRRHQQQSRQQQGWISASSDLETDGFSEKSAAPEAETERETSDSDLQVNRRLRNSRRGTGQGANSTSRNPHTKAARHLRRSNRDHEALARNVGQFAGDPGILDADMEVAVAPRAIGARERFKKILPEDEFSRRHCQWCDTCGERGNSTEKGLLVLCQGCTLSYHQVCLGSRHTREHIVTKVANDDCVLQCRRCVGSVEKKDITAPKLGLCQVCREPGSSCIPFRDRKTARQEQKEREENGGEDPITSVSFDLLNKVETLLFRCQTCHRGFHLDHLPTPPQIDQQSLDANELSEARIKAYIDEWLCLDCIDMSKPIQALIAWRPTNQADQRNGLTSGMLDADAKEYLVRLKGQSYFRVKWMPGAWVWGLAAPASIRAFEKRKSPPKMSTEEAVPEEYLRIDIVLDVKYREGVQPPSDGAVLDLLDQVDSAYVKYKGLGYEDVVWETVPDSTDSERWSDFKIAYEDYAKGWQISTPAPKVMRERLAAVRAKNFERDLVKKEQPSMLTGKLMDYQLEGLNWAYYKWFKQQNAILADEMGLGKTIQIIGLLATLVHDHSCFPFLVVVPNSTCPNWRREIKQWAPSLRVVAYYGSSKARELALKHELCPKGDYVLGCHIVVTSYEIPVDETSREFLTRIRWQGLIVDEGQRLKNDKSLLYNALERLKIPFKILMTGTPLQNNARELFNLLQFLDRKLDASQMETDYAHLTKEKIEELHDIIRPCFLRRTKAQVLTFLPPVAQIIVPVSMTILQKQLYKSILARNPELIESIFNRKQKLKQKERSNLNNILMQLRKCLCHPFLYSKRIEELDADPAAMQTNLVEASAKLQLLQLMLPKLKARGHRVLIFSQFLEMLDIIEDFLHGLNLKYERLDGSVGSLQKQRRIDAFNAPDSALFAFLLSTRAGGVGINLATADTVIIMDPDFNPHQDIQALSRAHRIGQKKKVLVFQLMTRDSAEERIVQNGRRKMALDHVLVEQIDAEDDAGKDLESILTHGVVALFEEGDDHDIKYDGASIDKLLDRSQAEDTITGDNKSAETQFSHARIWVNDKSGLEEDFQVSTTDSTLLQPGWHEILHGRAEDAAKERANRDEQMGRGKRTRRQIVQLDEHLAEGFDEIPYPARSPRVQSSTDEDFEIRANEGEGEEEESDEDFQEPKDDTMWMSAGTNPATQPFRPGQSIHVSGPLRTDPRQAIPRIPPGTPIRSVADPRIQVLSSVPMGQERARIQNPNFAPPAQWRGPQYLGTAVQPPIGPVSNPSMTTKAIDHYSSLTSPASQPPRIQGAKVSKRQDPPSLLAHTPMMPVTPNFNPRLSAQAMLPPYSGPVGAGQPQLYNSDTVQYTLPSHQAPSISNHQTSSDPRTHFGNSDMVNSQRASHSADGKGAAGQTRKMVESTNRSIAKHSHRQTATGIGTSGPLHQIVQDDDDDILSARLSKHSPFKERASSNQAGQKHQIALPGRASLDSAPTVQGGEGEKKECFACSKKHPVEECHLFLAGPEFCPLCGQAHFGRGTACPQFNSEEHVVKMLAALKESDEDPALIFQARTYLYGRKADLVRRRKMSAN